MTTWTAKDCDAWYVISEQLAVARYGHTWILVDLTTGAQLGPGRSTREQVRMDATLRLMRGDYR